MATLNYYKGLWEEMIENDREKVDHFSKIDQAIEFGIELPNELQQMKWMRNIQSTLPIEVIVVGSKVLCTIEPKIYLQPLNANEATIKKANEVEQNLLWQFHLMEKRFKHGMISEVVESALRYDSVATFTVPMKWQFKGQAGALPSRYKAAENYGGFITTVENPKNIHARYSPLGLDMVLNARIMRARDACLFYGERAKELWDEIKETEQEEFFVTVYDHWDYNERVTRISKPSESQVIQSPYGGYTVIKEDMELPFLPWDIREGGSSLATRPGHEVRPLLGPIVHADLLELELILQSMAFGEVTGYAAAPRYKVTSFDGESIEINYGDINKVVNLKPQETIEPMAPPQIDQNLLLVYDRIEASFSRLAGLKALAELETASGTAYATVNAQIKQATTALDPPKKLAERALSGVAENMLRWTAYTGDDMVGYGYKDDNKGVEYRTKSKFIDPQEIYVDVELSHHIPTDELSQINAATIMMKELNIAFVDAARKLNIPNPEQLKARWQQEQLVNAELRNRIKLMDAEADLQIQQKQMQLQMQAQQAVQAEQMQMQQQAQQQGGGMNAESESQARLAQAGFAPERTGNPRREAQSIAARGPGYNPARGGISPNEANPEGFTKEAMTGVDRRGNTI